MNLETSNTPLNVQPTDGVLELHLHLVVVHDGVDAPPDAGLYFLDIIRDNLKEDKIVDVKTK